MKSLLRVLVVSFILCGVVGSAAAELTCYPGARINSPGAGDNWICWGGYYSDCLFCSEEIIVRG